MTLAARARAMLAAWEAAQPLPGGLAFESLLRRCQLDYSLASLDRIDTLLDALRRTLKPQPQVFLQDAPQRNLVLLLALYAGEVAARATGQRAVWCSYEEMVALDPSAAVARPGFVTSLGCRFPAPPPARHRFFLPLGPIVTRLFRPEGGERSLRASVGALIGPEPPSPGPALPPVQAGQPPAKPAATAPSSPSGSTVPAPARAPTPAAVPAPATAPVTALLAPGSRPLPADAAARKALCMGRPDWVSGDKLAFLFDSEAALLRDGRLVWGALIQANRLLFVAGGAHGGGTGEVLYDPLGLMPTADLAALAKTLAPVKGQRLQDPALAAFAEALSESLTGETPRIFGLDVPRKLSAHALKASTTWFDRRLLPGGKLADTVFPVLISDAHPGAVLLLPQSQWPQDLLRKWVPVPPPTAAPAPLDPEALFRQGQAFFQGDRVAQDAQRAHACWLQAAAAGHAGAVMALAGQYASGEGVERDVALAIAYYREAAEQGDVQAQLEAGRLLLLRKEPSYDRKEATVWLKRAATQGSEEAEALLTQHGLQGEEKTDFLKTLIGRWRS